MGVFQTNSTKNKVKIGYLPLTKSLAVWVAKEKGFFNETGINAELTSLANSNDASNLTSQNTIDVGYIATTITVVQANKVNPDSLKIFSVESQNYKDWDGLFVKANSNIANLKDLEGKKIGVFPGTSGTNYLKNFLGKKGVETKGIQFVQLSANLQIPALENPGLILFLGMNPM